MKEKPQRGETFVGYRPSVMTVKKKNKKKERKENKQLCREIKEGASHNG